MEQYHQDVLIKNRSTLVCKIQVNEPFYKAMRNNHLITNRQESRLKHSGDKQTQVETLLDLLPRLGRDAFEKFCHCLRDTGQGNILQEHLNHSDVPGSEEGATCQPSTGNTLKQVVLDGALVPVNIVLVMMRVWLSIAERSKVIIEVIPANADDYMSTVTEKPGTTPSSGASDIPTPYCAPELCKTPPQHSHKADVWGIGCAVLNLLAGKSPWHDKIENPDKLKKFISSNPTEIQKYIPKETPAELKDVLLHMLATDRKTRWTASQLLDHDILRGDMEDDLVPLGKLQCAEKLSPVVSPSVNKRVGQRIGKTKTHSARNNNVIIDKDSDKEKRRHQQNNQQFFTIASQRKLSKTEESISTMIPGLISDTKQDWSEMWELFKRLGTWQNIAFLGVKDGMTMLHQIVYHDQQSFLDVLFNLGVWPKLIDVCSQGGSREYSNLTAMEMAQKMNRSSIWTAMEKLSRLEESMNQWHKAARIGDEAEIDRLLSQNPSPYVVNEPSMSGKTALYWAITNGSYSIIDKLVKAGADVYCKTEEGDILLTRAVSLNHDHLVRPLVSEWGLDVEQHGLNRKSSLYLASQNGHLPTFKVLLHVGASLTGLALISAAISGKVQFMKHLMEEYHLNSNWQDIMGKAPLLAAAAAGQIGSIDTLLDHGADITIVDKRKRNILHFAVEGGSEEALKRVIDICKERKILRGLLDAQDVYSGSESIFLVRGKDQGRPAWHYVLVQRVHQHTFREKTQGGPIDVAHYGHVVRSGWGHSPSQAAIHDIERQYSPDQIPPTAPLDLSPLMLAIVKGHHNLVVLLLKEKSKLETQDCFGLTAFHLACMKGSINTVKALAQAGCRTDVRDAKDRTPLMVARLNDHMVVVNYLEGCNDMKLVKKFTSGGLAKASRELDARSLETVQSRQGDLRRHAINSLRELQADINQVLYDLGSAPVGQASE